MGMSLTQGQTPLSGREDSSHRRYLIISPSNQSMKSWLGGGALDVPWSMYQYIIRGLL
jgi:hypothetical protein